MTGLKYRGKFIGIDPAHPDVVYANRDELRSWEEVELGASAPGVVSAWFPAARRYLSVTDLQALESRTQVGAWEQHRLVDDVLVAANGLAFDVDGAPATSPLMGPLRLDYTRLMCGDRRLFLKGATGFMAYEAFLDGRTSELLGVLGELERYGCNMLRVFGMAHYIPLHEHGRRSFAPANYGDRYYDALPEFLGLLAAHGMYCFWATFPDNGIIMPDLNAQLRHHDRLVPILEGAGTVVYELTNEATAHDFNAVPAEKFTKPTGMLACAGGYSDAADEYGAGRMLSPVWDFGSIHPSRDFKKGVMDCLPYDNAYFRAGKGLMVGEPCRYGSNGAPGGLSPEHARDAALAARAGAMGWVFHSRNGVRFERFDAETRRYADAVFVDAYGAV